MGVNREEIAWLHENLILYYRQQKFGNKENYDVMRLGFDKPQNVVGCKDSWWADSAPVVRESPKAQVGNQELMYMTCGRFHFNLFSSLFFLLFNEDCNYGCNKIKSARQVFWLQSSTNRLKPLLSWAQVPYGLTRLYLVWLDWVFCFS